MGQLIHSSAVIEDGAQIGADVTIGPFCMIGKGVTLGDGVTLHSHVVVSGNTSIGDRTEVFPFSVLGSAPQDLKFKGEDSKLIIGAHNKIREHVTMNPGTQGGGMITKVGDHCLFMVGAHVAHDCQVGNHVILANNATLAGHVEVGDHAILGGLSAVHQFVRIGAHAMIGGLSPVVADVIPFGLVMGERAKLAGLNLVGLDRRGFDKQAIQRMRRVFKTLFDENGTLSERLQTVSTDFADDAAIMDIVAFIENRGSRAICRPAA